MSSRCIVVTASIAAFLPRCFIFDQQQRHPECVSCESSQAASRRSKWKWMNSHKGTNHICHSKTKEPLAISFPQSKKQIQTILIRANENKTSLRFVGAETSLSNNAVSSEHVVSTQYMNHVIWINEQKKQIRVESGMMLSSLVQLLNDAGLHLPILPSNTHQTVGGILGIAAHGTGSQYRSLSSYVAGFELITPSGEIIECNEQTNSDIFKAGLCHLGGLGYISEVTFNLETAFKLRAIRTLEDINEVLNRLTEISLGHSHVRMQWLPYTSSMILWVYDTCPFETINTIKDHFEKRQFFFFNYLYEPLLFVSRIIPSFGKKINKFLTYIMKHRREMIEFSYNIFPIGPFPVGGCISEWVIPASNLPRALHRTRKLMERHPDSGCTGPIEIEFQKTDDILLSPAYNPEEPQNSETSLLHNIACSISITIKTPFNLPLTDKSILFLQAFDEVMLNLGARPSWVNHLHRLDANNFKELYPCFHQWINVREKLDPNQVMVNEWMKQLFDSHRTGDISKKQSLRNVMSWTDAY